MHCQVPINVDYVRCSQFCFSVHTCGIHVHTCGMSTHECMHTLHVNSKYTRELSNHNCEEFLGYGPFIQFQQAESRAQ